MHVYNFLYKQIKCYFKCHDNFNLKKKSSPKIRRWYNYIYIIQFAYSFDHIIKIQWLEINFTFSCNSVRTYWEERNLNPFGMFRCFSVLSMQWIGADSDGWSEYSVLHFTGLQQWGGDLQQVNRQRAPENKHFLKKNQQHLNNSTIRNKVTSRNKTSFDSGQETMRNKIRFTINKILSRHEKSTN